MKTTFVVSAMLAGLAMASPAQQPQPQPQNGACKVNNDCKPNEHCDNTGACVVSKTARDAPLAQLNQACHVDGDCAKDLACVKDVCSPAKNKRDAPLAHVNQPCKTNGDCVKGLQCERDTCVVPKDKRDVSRPEENIQAKQKLIRQFKRTPSPRPTSLARTTVIASRVFSVRRTPVSPLSI